MSTSRTPVAKLRAQAFVIASTLRKAARGEPLGDGDPGGRIAGARGKPSFKMGIAMDDKVITLEITWAKILDTTEAALTEYIVKLMRGQKEDA